MANVIGQDCVSVFHMQGLRHFSQLGDCATSPVCPDVGWFRFGFWYLDFLHDNQISRLEHPLHLCRTTLDVCHADRLSIEYGNLPQTKDADAGQPADTCH